MILDGKQRSGGKQLGKYLVALGENDHVVPKQVRGFASNDVAGAMAEAEAVAKGTKCQKYLFSVSFNPPEKANVTDKDFFAAADKLEKRLGLEGHQRVAVSHEKNGRQHWHVMWNRIDPETMLAKELKLYKLTMREVSRELFLEHGWKMPRGLEARGKRDPLAFTRGEYEQAKREGQHPADVKALVREAFGKGEGGLKGFIERLEQHGLVLARGERRGLVVVDQLGGVKSLARLLNIKTKDVRRLFGDGEGLRTAADAQAQFGEVKELPDIRAKIKEARVNFEQRSAKLAQYRVEMNGYHSRERADLGGRHAGEWAKSTAERQARMPRGLRGLWSWVTGETARIKSNNEMEAKAQAARQQQERDSVSARQREERRIIHEQTKALRKQQASLLLDLRKQLGRQMMEIRLGRRVGGSLQSARKLDL